MSDINKYTTKEVLNKVLLDSSGNAVNAYSHTSQEALNAALDDTNSRLNVNLVGGTIGGDVTINGDLTVNGDSEGAYDEIVNGNLHIKSDSGNSANAFLVEKNDGTDVFVVDTTNVSGAGINTAAGGWGLNVKGVDANVFKVLASDGNTLSFLQGTNGDATQKWFADGNDTKVLINTNGDSYFTGGSLGVGTASPPDFPAENVTIEGATAGLVLRDTTGSNQATQFFTLYSSNGDIIGMFDDSKSLKFGHADDAVGTNYTDVLTLGSDNSATFAGDITGASGLSINWLNSNTRITGSNSSGFLQFDVGGTSEVLKLTSSSSTFGNNVTVNGDTLSLVKSNNNAFLKVESTDGGEAIFEMKATTNRTNQIRFFEGATQRGSIVYNHASQSLTFNTGDSPTAKLVLDDDSRISLSNNGGGTGNTIFGKSASPSQAGSNNTIMGENSALAMDGGEAHNIVIGSSAMRGADEGASGTIDFNVVVGNSALWGASFTGSQTLFGNIAIGYQALNKDGDTNSSTGQVAIGHQALKSMTSGSGNMGIGYLAGTSLTSGVNNVAIGANALDELSTGGYNTAIGVNALHQVDNGEAENVAIGYNAGSNLDGDGGTASGNVCIGSQAIPSSSGGLNQIVIGKDTTGVANNSVTLGNASVTDVYMAQDQRAKMHSGQIETIMDSSTNANIAVIRSENSSDYSSSVLHVTGDRTTTNNTYNLANFTNAGTSKCIITDGGDLKNTNNSYGAISDEKLKQDIEDASSQWDDIKAVRFRKFKFKDNVEDGFKLGVVAQELEKVSPSLISESIDRDADGKDLGTTTKSVKYSILQMKGIVALQEALNRIETLEAKVKELESK